MSRVCACWTRDGSLSITNASVPEVSPHCCSFLKPTSFLLAGALPWGLVAGRDTDGCLWGWRSSVKSSIDTPFRPTSKILFSSYIKEKTHTNNMFVRHKVTWNARTHTHVCILTTHKFSWTVWINSATNFAKISCKGLEFSLHTHTFIE